MKQPDRSLDVWKGFAILAVIGIHVSNAAFTFPEGSGNEWWGIAYRTPLNIAVALFFAISGYLAPSAADVEKAGLAKYYSSRLLRLWPPYLIWTAIFLAINAPSSLLDVKVVAKAIALGQGIGIGYFVIVLTSLVLLHPLFVKLSRGVFLGGSALLTIVTLAAIYYARLKLPDSILARFPYFALPFTTWIVFYAQGFYLKDRSAPGIPRKALIALLGLSLVLVAAESYYLWQVKGEALFAAGQIKFSNYLLSAVVIIIALTEKGLFASGNVIFEWLGKRSYLIYLCHVLFIMGVEKTLAGTAFFNQQWLYIPLMTIVVAVAVSLFIGVAEAVFPAPLAYWVLGIKKRDRATVPAAK